MSILAAMFQRTCKYCALARCCLSAVGRNFSNVTTVHPPTKILGSQIQCSKVGTSSLLNLHRAVPSGLLWLTSQQARFKSDDPCSKPVEDACTTPGIKKNPCGKPKAKKSKSKKKSQPKFESMWDVPDCKLDKDCDINIPYDIKHYRISDKKKRKYQVTWDECPRLLIKPRKVCFYHDFKKTVRERRCRKLPCRPPAIVAEPMDCVIPLPKDEKCPRIRSACGGGRIPPRCVKVKVRVPCKKRNAPYPSFSECKKDPPEELSPTECKCLDIPMMCEVWVEMRRRLSKGLTPIPNKCGSR